MLLARYPVGDFTALPLPPITADVATFLHEALTPDEWTLVRAPTTDLHALSRTLATAHDLSASYVHDALQELSQVAVFGWPAYVDTSRAAQRLDETRVCLFYALVLFSACVLGCLART